MFHTQIVGKSKYVICSIIFFFENRADNVEKYGTAGQAIDGNITWSMRYITQIQRDATV